jgi:hypothetical protein
LLAFLCSPASPAWAQTIQGTVLDDEWSVPIETAGVALVAENDSVVAEYITDERGRFVAHLPDSGSYRLRATRIGYTPAMSNAFQLGPGQDALAQLRLQPSPILLDPLAAIVEGQNLSLARVGFYRREAMGFGHILTPEELARKPGLHQLDDLFNSMPGVGVVRSGLDDFDVFSTRGIPCRMSVAINGQVIQTGGRNRGGTGWSSSVSILNVAAIEVYPGQAGLPVWMAGSRSPCGAVVIWTTGYIR